MGRVAVAIRKRWAASATSGPAPVAAPCHAPFGQLFLDPLGNVSTCCLANGYVLGNVAEQRLPDIWHGARLAQVRQAMVDHDFSLGCQGCDRIIQAGMPGLHHAYDHLAPSTMAPEYPRRLEINISNACNLQCVMCDGTYSSAIRIHREHLPPLPKVYDEQFFADLAEFIPHLEEVSFTGGEPFLAPEYERIWDLMAELNPGIRVLVTTNATKWSPRVERILSRLRFSVNVSLDGASKATFERVRVGADWDEVRANVDRFAEYTRRVGTALTIFHCLMPENFDELGDLLLLADSLDVDVHVHPVVSPLASSLEHSADWDAVVDSFQRQAEEVLPRLGRNASVFEVQFKRVMDGGLRRPEWRLFGLPRIGQPGFDEAALAKAIDVDLERLAEFRVVVGDDERLREVAPPLAAHLGVTIEEMGGWTLEDFDSAMVARFGPRELVATSAKTDDYLRQEVRYGSTRFDAVTMASRDSTGSTTDVRFYAERLD